jgi:2-polyprenyl-3-methyl-5-hydroxy-6-metoxy-1,4-benzoquinol methylase
MHIAFPWTDPEFVAAYCAAVRTNAYNAHYERPAVQALLPLHVAGKHVLDAGCAGGALSEWLLSQGAIVHARDASPHMIAHLQARLGDQVDAQVTDLAQPMDDIKDATMDAVVSSLTLHYLRDWGPTLKEFRRILKPDCPLICSTHHPFADFTQSLTGDYHAIEYIEEQWGSFTERPVAVGFYRRPLTAILEALADAGFQLECIVEPQPTAECAVIFPAQYVRLRTQPIFIVVRAWRT